MNGGQRHMRHRVWGGPLGEQGSASQQAWEPLHMGQGDRGKRTGGRSQRRWQYCEVTGHFWGGGWQE